jgi:cell division protein FtsW (lipid II flippase)
MSAPVVRRTLDFTLYVLIGLAVGVLVLWAASGGSSRDAVSKWGALAAVTILLFGSVIANRRHLVWQLSFWGVLLAFLIGHILVFIVVLLNAERWKAIWWAPVFPIEMVAIDTALTLVGLDPFRSKRRKSRRAPANKSDTHP